MAHGMTVAVITSREESGAERGKQGGHRFRPSGVALGAQRLVPDVIAGVAVELDHVFSKAARSSCTMVPGTWATMSMICTRLSAPSRSPRSRWGTQPAARAV